MRIVSICIAGLLAGFIPASGQELTDTQLELFEDDALPILEEHCFKCHGGSDKQESDLDLTSRIGLLRGGVRGASLNLDNPDASLILEMISYKDEEHQMPPKTPLESWDAEALTEWIQTGAPWPGQMEINPSDLREIPDVDLSDSKYWGFRPVADEQPPTINDADWSTNPIDRFIYQKLSDTGLTPSPLAPKRTLIRRAYFDLLGLPPTPEEVEAFVADGSPEAWEMLIERLLASPHYGEKWGRHWLDLVRYADSNGYERDSNKPFMWRYRDYVIRAFNEDKPYDRFILEQLAGDELENPQEDEITATGYYRLGLWDDEPADPLLSRYDNLDSIVDTTSRVFLGITMGCARCHSHKLDPIPQEDYYRFLSFFQNTTGLQRNKGGFGILRSIGTPEEEAQHEDAIRVFRSEESRLQRRVTESALHFAAKAGRTNSELLEGAGPEPTLLNSLNYAVYSTEATRLPKLDKLSSERNGALEHGFASLAPGDDTNGVAFAFEGILGVPETGEFKLHVSASGALRIDVDGKSIIDRKRRSDISREETLKLENRETPIRIEYLPKDDARALKIQVSGPGLEGRRTLTYPTQFKENTGKLIRMTRKHGKQILGEKSYAEFEAERKQLETLRAERPQLPMAASIAEDGSDAPPTHVLVRGNPHVPGKEVTPGFPVILSTEIPVAPSPYQTEATTGRRRQLAEWIGSPENPMTGRVMANRLWQYHFNRGIVRSSNNFGSAGSKPTHLELLDWLAKEMVRRDWRLKPMHKLIMMSRTYRMSSRGNDANLAKDPANNLLWRYNMRRLTAEEVRDTILAVSGNFNDKMFGPGIFPELAPEVLATSSKQDEIVSSGMWGESSPEEQARRSVYVQVKRSLRPALFHDFDGADTDASCPVRFATSQPTQALNLLNSMFTHEQSQIFAERLREESGESVRTQVERALEVGLSRAPEAKEVDMALRFVDEMQREEALSEEKAIERFCLLVLNLNEFLYLD